MKISLKALFTSAVLFGSVMAVSATTWYVSPAGKNKNAGTSADAPLKAIWKAIENASAGDTIYVAQGNYTGKTDCGFITIDKPLMIYGGYADDFSSRDVSKYRSSIRPTNEMGMTPPPNGTVEFKFDNCPSEKCVFDGFFLDHSEANAYSKVKGKPEGVQTGLWLEPPTKEDNPCGSLKKYLVYGNTDGELTISNCVFLNSSNYALNINHKTGTVNIKNNVFLNSRMMACNVSCRSAKAFDTKLNFTNNTVLFTWARTKELSDMGYGVRALSKVDCHIEKNILGLSCMSGFDNSMNNRKGEAKVTLDDNMFFLNKKGDISFTISPSIKYLKVDDDAFEDFEDFDGIESCENNVSLNNPKAFKGIIDQAYLDGFLSASYTETTDFNPNSPANQFRAAMGMNQQGKIDSTATMYANRYPDVNIMKFFGAIDGYGAQKISN